MDTNADEEAAIARLTTAENNDGALDAIIESKPILRYSVAPTGKGKGKKGKGKKGSWNRWSNNAAEQRKKVPQEYICRACGKKGDHFYEQCPSFLTDDKDETVTYETWAASADAGKRPGGNIKYARGIPMNYLREV